MKPSETLKAARQLIDAPEKWCQKYYAMTEQGTFTEWWSEDACKFCALGAVLRTVNDINNPARTDYVSGFLQRVAPMQTAGSTNDHGTHADVMGMFDAAIALAEAEGK